MVPDHSKIPLPASMLSRSTVGGRQNGQHATKPVVNGKPAAKRRGFGLFSDDEGEDTEAESSRLSVSFSGNKSGFQELGKTKGNRRMSIDGTELYPALPKTMSASFPAYSPPKQTKAPRNSRNSQLTTPKRSGRVSHRNTPYSTTTSRALKRAKEAQKATLSQEEDQLIGETSYEEPPLSQRKRSPYTMHGAKASNNQEYDEEKTDEDQSGDASDEQDFKITPSRNIFSRTNTPVGTPVKTPNASQQSPPATGKKTWGQWLGAILPDSVKKPVKAILGAPGDGTKQTKDLIVGTPQKDSMEEDYPEGYSLPGSFGKPDDGRRTPPLLLNYEHGAGNNRYGNEASTSKNFSGTPSRVGSSDLFVYDKPKAVVKSTAPSKRARRSTMSTPIKSNKALPPVSSLHKPNNFIERMRTAKIHRYDPYARRTPPRKEKIQLTIEEEKELTPAEKLELLKQRQKERKIAALEDKYEMREALRAMGQVPDDDEQMTDSDSERRPRDKGKGLEGTPSMAVSINQPTVEDAPEESPEATSITKLPIAPSSPPKSPVKKARESPQKMPSRNLFEASAPVPSFLLAGDVDTGPGFIISDAPPPAEIPAISLNTPPTWSFGSDSSDKENISAGPPPPPTMSHAQLPTPLTSSVQPPTVSLFESQPTGGFGLGPPKESTAVGRQRSQAEKFKPMVSSSLRESRSAADYDDKENQSEKEGKENGEGSKKGGETELKKKGLMLQQTQGSNVFAKKGLKENAGVINVGKSDVKVDVRAKVEALSSKQLASSVVWPFSDSFGSQVMKDAVANAWTGRLAEYPTGFGELFSQAVTV